MKLGSPIPFATKTTARLLECERGTFVTLALENRMGGPVENPYLTERGFSALLRRFSALLRRFSALLRSSGEAVGGQGAGGVEEPRQRLARVAAGGEIALDVLDGGLEHVQQVVQLVELPARHDELVLGQADLACTRPPEVLLLAARRPAELPRPSRAGRGGQRTPAVPASPVRVVFRHLTKR